MIQIHIKEKSIKDNIILKDINFEINKGEIIGLVGENGAGKSSTMKSITGLTKNFIGSVTYNEKTVNENLIFSSFIEYPKFIESLTGQENINYFLTLANRKIPINLENLIASWGLSKHLNKKVKNYSLGTKQKLGLIITMLFDRPFYIFDEPTNGIDDDSRRSFFSYLKLLKSENKGILISSHNLNDINEICDRIVKVNNGTIENSNYTFKKFISMSIPNVDKNFIAQYFNIIRSEGDILIVEYKEDFITKLNIINTKYKNINLISINNFYND
ncbi:MAG: ABC transporter ATP-binding protein [Paraclostridium sordellii]